MEFFLLLLQAMEIIERQQKLIARLESQRDTALDLAKQANRTTKSLLEMMERGK